MRKTLQTSSKSKSRKSPSFSKKTTSLAKHPTMEDLYVKIEDYAIALTHKWKLAEDGAIPNTVIEQRLFANYFQWTNSFLKAAVDSLQIKIIFPSKNILVVMNRALCERLVDSFSRILSIQWLRINFFYSMPKHFSAEFWGIFGKIKSVKCNNRCKIKQKITYSLLGR